MTGKISETLKLPKDMVNGASVITVTGNEDIWIENYKGILDYTEDKIVLLLKKGKIMFEGKKLQIVFYSGEEMQITGTFDVIRFIN